MCTLSWWSRGEKRAVLFNRDEKRTRAPGLPGRLFQTAGCNPFLAPLDPSGGGTWIGINRTGLIAALLNHYPAEAASPEQAPSRGLLVKAILGTCAQRGDARQLLKALDPFPFRPFLLFLMDAEARTQFWTWDGRTLEPSLPPGQGHMPMVTTSSVRGEECRAHRASIFPRDADEYPQLLRFHQTLNPRDHALGPLMTREDARTESMTEIVADSARASLRFRPVEGATARAGPVEEIELALQTRPLFPG